VLVPLLGGHETPLSDFLQRVRAMPLLTIASVAIGYLFPFLVSLYSSALTRYKAQRERSLALFPESKPDPVFRAALDGTILEAGAATLVLFRRFGIENAAEFLGKDAWSQVLSQLDAGSANPDLRVHFAPEQQSYLVVWARVESGVNLYLTRLAG
jgi:hypothetical protein